MVAEQHMFNGFPQQSRDSFRQDPVWRSLVSSFFSVSGRLDAEYPHETFSAGRPNIARHAHVSEVSVSQNKNPGELMLQVQDDGRGIAQ